MKLFKLNKCCQGEPVEPGILNEAAFDKLRLTSCFYNISIKK